MASYHALIGKVSKEMAFEEPLFSIHLPAVTEIGRDGGASVPRYDARSARILFPGERLMDQLIEEHHGRIVVDQDRVSYVHTGTRKMFTVAYDPLTGALSIAQYPGDTLELLAQDAPYLLLGDATDVDWDPKTAIESLSDFIAHYYVRIENG